MFLSFNCYSNLHLHTDGLVVPAFDQGCYTDGGISGAVRRDNVDDIDSCITSCRNGGYNFSGIRVILLLLETSFLTYLLIRVSFPFFQDFFSNFVFCFRQWCAWNIMHLEWFATNCSVLLHQWIVSKAQSAGISLLWTMWFLCLR